MVVNLDKYVFKMLFIFAIFCIIIGAVKADENLLYGKCVYVDPGHGGTDPGAIYANIKEEEFKVDDQEQVEYAKISKKEKWKKSSICIRSRM